MPKRIALLALCSLFAGCSGASGVTQITGAGSTFDYPFFSKAFYLYSSRHPQITVNYQPIGSGGGIQQFTQKTVDFGASDVPMNAAELARAGSTVVQVPVALGGEVLSYNVPGVPGGLRLSGKAVADIFLGKIGSWNDPELAALNPGKKLPKAPIVVVHRSEASGTTYIFTDYLSSISPEWKTRVGKGKSVSWPAPASVGGKGNEGVAGLIRNTPGAIGYVELAYALQNSMATATLQNRAGNWIACTQQSVRAAAAAKPSVSATSFSIVNGAGAQSYPIAGYSWAIVYKDPANRARAKIVRDVLEWLIGNEAQQIGASLSYVPLPANVAISARRSLQTINV